MPKIQISIEIPENIDFESFRETLYATINDFVLETQTEFNLPQTPDFDLTIIE